MSSEQVAPKVEFTAEQSKELSSLLLGYLEKILTKEVISGLEVGVEFRFTPKAEEAMTTMAMVDNIGINNSNIKISATAIGRCIIGTPQHPFCPNGQKWVS